MKSMRGVPERAAWWLVLGAIWVLPPAAAETGLLRVSVACERVPEGVRVPVTLDLARLDSTAGERVRVPLSAPGSVELDLPASSSWQATVIAPQGYWGRAARVDVTASGARLALSLTPAGRLSGLLLTPPLEPEPAAVELRLREAGAVAPLSAEEGLTLECPVVEHEFTCSVPSGRHDFRLHLPGLVPAYRWDVDVAPGRTRRLGGVRMRAGASLAGFVAREDGLPAAAASVALAASGVRDLAAERGDGRAELLTRRVRTNEHGFFQFDGVEEGSYEVSASVEGMADARIGPVAVFDRLESVLAEPLVLAEPARLALAVEPPLDWEGERWTVHLLLQHARSRAPQDARRGELDELGSWTEEDLSPGSYQLVLEDSAGSRWPQERIELVSGENELFLAVESIEVAGVVRCADEPVAGTLWFGRPDGTRRVRLVAGADGGFEGRLPALGRWPVTVEPRGGSQRVALPDVEVTLGRGEETAWVALELPAATLSGRVVDTNGRPVVDAEVWVLHGDGILNRARSGVAGLFEVAGVGVGTASIRAEGDGLESDSYAVGVEAGDDPPFLELVLRDKRALEGRVMAAGRPVAGARILAWPVVPPRGAVGGDEQLSDPHGRFRVELQRGSEVNLLVMAAGYALGVETVPASAGPVEISLDPAGGTLRLALPTSPGAPPLLRIERTVVPLGLLRWWASSQGGAVADDHLVVPALPVGTYSLCPQGGHGACASGFLQLAGELSLGLDPLGAAAGGAR